MDIKFQKQIGKRDHQNEMILLKKTMIQVMNHIDDFVDLLFDEQTDFETS